METYIWKVILVLPPIIDVNERCLSALTRVKSFPHYTILSNRLNQLIILHLYQSITDSLNLTMTCQEFVARKEASGHCSGHLTDNIKLSISVQTMKSMLFRSRKETLPHLRWTYLTAFFWKPLSIFTKKLYPPGFLEATLTTKSNLVISGLFQKLIIFLEIIKRIVPLIGPALVFVGCNYRAQFTTLNFWKNIFIWNDQKWNLFRINALIPQMAKVRPV